jgi:hypothetical protein
MSEKAYICRFVVAYRQRHFVSKCRVDGSGRHLFDTIGAQLLQASLVVPIIYKSVPSGRPFARSPEPRRTRPQLAYLDAGDSARFTVRCVCCSLTRPIEFQNR